MPDVPVTRLEGKQSPDSLAARYPKILQNTDQAATRVRRRRPNPASAGRPGLADTPPDERRRIHRSVPACSMSAWMLLPIYRSAVRQFDSRVRAVRPEQWTVSTPDDRLGRPPTGAARHRRPGERCRRCSPAGQPARLDLDARRDRRRVGRALGVRVRGRGRRADTGPSSLRPADAARRTASRPPRNSAGGWPPI